MKNTHKHSQILAGFCEKIPEYTPTFDEVSKQMRINVDILKQEITQHVDCELIRFHNTIPKE